jgi:hypothetical protein
VRGGQYVIITAHALADVSKPAFEAFLKMAIAAHGAARSGSSIEVLRAKVARLPKKAKTRG